MASGRRPACSNCAGQIRGAWQEGQLLRGVHMPVQLSAIINCSLFQPLPCSPGLLCLEAAGQGARVLCLLRKSGRRDAAQKMRGRIQCPMQGKEEAAGLSAGCRKPIK